VCLRTIAPKILTWGQYAEAAINLFQKTVMARDLPEYVPDFTKCVDHFALHAGAWLCCPSYLYLLCAWVGLNPLEANLQQSPCCTSVHVLYPCSSVYELMGCS
jgi:hypothetical protein